MNIEIITIFPKMFKSVFNTSILKRAIEKGKIKVKLHNLRDFTTDKHRSVDDASYGGGGGMVLKIEPLVRCLKKIESTNRKYRKILLTPVGEKFNQKKAVKLSKQENLVFICGHYEGIDERIRYFIDEEISIGDYVLTGGELAAMVIIDAVVRLLKGTLGNKDSAKNDSFMKGLLDFPHYTRPASFMKLKVPEVLLSGNHKEIEEWRRKESLRRTKERRPDLL